MRMPTVYATLDDRERMALHPMDDRVPDSDNKHDRRFGFPVLWRVTGGYHRDTDEACWTPSCLSSTAPRVDEQVVYKGCRYHASLLYGSYWWRHRGNLVFKDDADAIAWLIKQEGL